MCEDSEAKRPGMQRGSYTTPFVVQKERETKQQHFTGVTSLFNICYVLGFWLD